MLLTGAVILSTLVAIVLVLAVFSVGSRFALAESVKLPEPKHDSKVSVEKALSERRSVREFAKEAVSLAEVSQLLWATQGVTNPAGYRTAPSAGALYPLEVYLVAGQVTSLPAGIYRYSPYGHELVKIVDGDKRVELCAAALGQTALKQAPATIVLAAIYERTTRKYRGRGIRYVHMEAGHAAQNLCLQAVSLDLGSVVIGAFYDEEVKKVLSLPGEEEPLYAIPFGKRSQ